MEELEKLTANLAKKFEQSLQRDTIHRPGQSDGDGDGTGRCLRATALGDASSVSQRPFHKVPLSKGEKAKLFGRCL